MQPFSPAELDAVLAIRSELSTWREAAPPVLSQLLLPLKELLGADRAVAFGLTAADGRLSVSFLHVDQREAESRAVLERIYGESPTEAAAFNPARPDPAQRNRPLNFENLRRISERAEQNRMRQEGFGPLGLAGLDQLRVLVCEGDSLLGWVGGFRDGNFGERELGLLGQLVPSLRQRLWMERQLDLSRFALAALDEALARIPAPAFVVHRDGRVAHANALGRSHLERDRAGTRERLSMSTRHPGAQAPFEITPLVARGAPDHLLAVERSVDPAVRENVGADAARRWQLTPRQAQLLALLLRGYSNKSIAHALQCSVKTVEVHLTAILRKAKASSRAQLIASLIPPG